MKIKTLKKMAFDGVPRPVGTIVEVSNIFGKQLVVQGRAVESAEDAEAEAKADDGHTFLAGTDGTDDEPTEQRATVGKRKSKA